MKLNWGDRAAQLVSERIAAPETSTTTIKAIPADRRVDGMVCVDLGTSALWVFDADSAANASDTVLVPTAGTGRWLSASSGAIADAKPSVRAATTGNLVATRTGNVLLADANGALAAQDGVTMVVGDRILVKNQTATEDNGIYYITALGGGAAKHSFTRAPDADTSAKVTAGLTVFVSEGMVAGNHDYQLTTDDAITLNTTGLTFAKLPILADFSSTANGFGASLSGVEDAAGRFAGTTVETVTTDLGARIALAFANAAAMTAYAAAARADGQIALMLDDGTIWDFDSGSAAGATDWVRVPDAGTGRWLRRMASLAEFASTANAKGAALVGIEDSATIITATTVEGALAEIKALVDAGLTLTKRTVTIGHADLTNAANGAADTINLGAVLPANARIIGASIHTVTPFSGAGATAVAFDIGTAGDVDAIVDGADLFAAAVDGQANTLPTGIAPNKLFAGAGAQLIVTVTPDGGHALLGLDAGSAIVDVLYTVVA